MQEDIGIYLLFISECVIFGCLVNFAKNHISVSRN